MRKILGFVLGLPSAITLFLAFSGAIVALFGGVVGLENARVLGGTICSIGALGFFVLLLSPYGELFSLLGSTNSGGPPKSNVYAAAPPETSAPGKKDS